MWDVGCGRTRRSLFQVDHEVTTQGSKVVPSFGAEKVKKNPEYGTTLTLYAVVKGGKGGKENNTEERCFSSKLKGGYGRSPYFLAMGCVMQFNWSQQISRDFTCGS